MSADDIVKLDVGGSVFKTSRATLTKSEGIFKEMFETEEKIKQDENGCIFIDRDPKHFRLILNYMRDDDTILPESAKEIQEILKEAECYRLEGLVEMCKEKIPGGTQKFKTIETDFEMMQIITNPRKPVIIIHYRMENWETATRYFNITQFQEKYKNHFDIYFKLATGPETTWSYSIHDKHPTLYSTPKTCQENNFVWSLESCIARFNDVLEQRYQ